MWEHVGVKTYKDSVSCNLKNTSSSQQANLKRDSLSVH